MTTATKKTAKAKAPSGFQIIKNHVLEQIHCGAWKEGDMIPGEEALAKTFGLSRMTANRAIRELSDEQVVERKQGSGTYVAQQKYQSTLVEIRNIADEITARGHVHSAEMHLLERCKAGSSMARTFGLNANHAVYHSVVVHFENNIAIQVEERFVNPKVAPDYLNQDFSTLTPNAYLMKVAPLQSVSFEIEARIPPDDISNMLQMPPREPCLLLHRQTHSMGKVASIANMWHPASRYRFAGNF
jgi:GntR family transcriptional regulator, histidine utilization repressor